MAVRKKISTKAEGRDSMNLSQELTQVREAIINLPTDEGAAMENPATEGQGTQAAKSIVKKKPSPKKAAVKKAPTENSVSLAELCKPLKLTSRTGRRALREAKLKNPGRWSWPKGRVPPGVTKALKEASAS